MFPIYRVEFDVYVDGVENPIQCRQDMMVANCLQDHMTAERSLRRMVDTLTARLGVLNKEIETWNGCFYLLRMDTWCLHYDSHYTYRRFSWCPLDDFKEYLSRHPEEAEGIDLDTVHVCGCDVCKQLNRTMILHKGEDECPTCLSVS